ncbi:JmjC domain-containing protein [Bacillus cereus]
MVGGFKTHFDAYTNFIFQIKGKKIWKLMDNNNVDNPMQHYDLAEYPYKPEELQTYWKGEGPDEELSKGEIIELIPGSMLYLPRGLWHSTKSNEETLAFNITFGQPTWLELLLFSIRKELITDPKWRELACNYSSLSEAEQKNLDTNLLNSLQEMQEKLNNLKPEDIYKCQNSDFDIYQSTQLVFRQLLSR